MTVWDDEYRPYGRNEGRRGSPSQWKRAYEKISGRIEIKITGTPWEILGLLDTCTLQDVKKAYRFLAFKTHPDQGGSNESFRRVNEAYQKIYRKFMK